MTSELDILAENIASRAGGKYLLDTKDVAGILNRSETTIRRWKKACINLEFRKAGNATNSPIEYSVKSVAKYLLKQGTKVVDCD